MKYISTMIRLSSQFVLDKAFSDFEEERLNAAIDQALITGDREAFMRLSEEKRNRMERTYVVEEDHEDTIIRKMNPSIESASHAHLYGLVADEIVSNLTKLMDKDFSDDDFDTSF
jgi:hypothetical protein